MSETRRRDPNRLMPADPESRAIARELYDSIAGAPIISPHGHVPAEMLADDTRFTDPAKLFVTEDHYITRLLHADGVALEDLGVAGSAADPREIWRLFAERWHLFAGTSSGYWIGESLSTVFGIEDELGAESADRIYDQIAARLGDPDMRPRALFERFGISVLATTDDPLDDLAAHRAIAASDLPGRVLPAFRPELYLDPDAPVFRERVDALLAATGQPATFDGYLEALRARRAHFVANGAMSSDHAVVEPLAVALDHAEASALFDQVVSGRADASQRRLFRGHMLWQSARMSVDDGLVMTVRAGVLRNYHSSTFQRFGPDTGHDIPVSMSYSQGLRPLLESFGNEPNLHVVLFTVDETNYSREIAPLAGFFRSVYIGAPWWFLDAPDAIARFRAAVTETAGFYRTSGFVDDTRAFLSIPARHDTARRADAAFLARLVREGRVPMATATRIIGDLVDSIPRQVFKL